MIAIDDNFKISENGGTGNATIFVSATDKNLFSTASTQVEVSTSVGGNIKRYVTLNKKAAHGYMYTPVEWISNEDIEPRIWIDLGYVWKDNSRAQLGFVIPGSHQKPNGQQVFGEDTVWSSDGNAPLDETNDLRLFFTKTGSNIGAYWDVGSARVQTTVGAITDVWQNWEIGNNYIKNLSNNTNFVTGSTYTISREGTVGLYGACQYLNTGRTDCVRYSYIKIYEGNTLIMDIIPVLDKDNIPCFFDKVGEQFYYYKVNGVPSTGLTAGNAIQELDYYQGDGTDYVDIGYIPNASTSIELDFESDSGDVFGATNRGASNGMFGYFQGGSWNWRYANRFDNFPQSTFSGRALYKMTPSGDYVNNVQKNSWSESWSNTSASFYIFGIHRESTGLSGAVFNGKIYGVKIFEGNTLVREYIPAKIGSKKGFYDKVLGNFYPSNSNSLIDGNILGNLTVSVIYSESDITINNETPSTAINAGDTFNLNASTSPTGATLTYSSSDTSIATVDSNGVVTAVAEGTAIITITAQGFQDNTNHIYYNTTSKTVSVETSDIAYMYTPVEWISNEGLNSQIWIDLGYTWTNTSKAEIGMIIPTGNTANGTEIFGEWFDWHYKSNHYEPVDDATNDLRLFFDDSKCYWDLIGNSRRQLSYEKGKAIIWQFGNQYLNNVNQKTTNTGATVDIGTRTSTVGLFGAPASGGYTHKARFYYVKIWEGDNLVRDVIPVLDSNNIPCFFDKVNANFHYYEVDGQPSTGLTAGGAIAEYSYIDNGGVTTSSANCYIPINYVWKTNSRAVMSLKVQSAQNGHLFSDEDGSNRLRLYPATGNQFKMEYRGTTITSSSRIWSNVQNIEIGNYYIKDTDTGNNIATGATKTDNQTTYCFLFGYSDKIQYYSVKIYEGDTLVCDLVPAMANNGYKGFWDKKREQFFFDWNNQNSRLYVGTKVQDIVVIKGYTESDITISNNTPSGALTIGNTFNLNASTTPTGATLSYSSSDTSIATVDNSGVVTAVGKGNATITITAQGFDDDVNKVHYNTTSKTVTVECAYQSQQIVITNSTPSEAINPNDTFDLNASTTPTGITLTYSSSDTSIATVNSNGVITGVATGTTTITISAQGFDDDVNKVHYDTTSKTVSVEVQEATPSAWDDDFLTIEALNPSTTITLKNPSDKNIWYRKDSETEYTKISEGDTSITIENANGYIKLYGDNKGVGTSSNTTAFNIYCQNNCNCYGKVTSLISSGCPETISSTYTFSRLFKQSLIVDARGLILPNNVSDYCYYEMFRSCTSLTQAPSLPATTLTQSCYSGMFWGCTSLTQAPSLPATTLASSCYQSMFRECTSLTQAPQLPATSLAMQCYSAMFYGCTSLSQAPSLPATSLALSCYISMFSGCSSLTQAPSLPATTLEQGCYSSMFYGCTSLSQAPSLPATTLASSCYQSMFRECTSLTQAPSLPATTLTQNCYNSMFRRCSNLSTVTLYYSGSAPTTSQGYFYNWLQIAGGTGCTIYAPANALWNSTDSTMSIPSNWTVEKTL